MTLAWDPKDPDEVLDYVINWATRLAGDTIADSTWTLPAGITKESDTFSASTTTIWLSGGTLNETYQVLNRIETTGGRTMDQTVKLRLKAK